MKTTTVSSVRGLIAISVMLLLSFSATAQVEQVFRIDNSDAFSFKIDNMTFMDGKNRFKTGENPDTQYIGELLFGRNRFDLVIKDAKTRKTVYAIYSGIKKTTPGFTLSKGDFNELEYSRISNGTKYTVSIRYYGLGTMVKTLYVSTTVFTNDTSWFVGSGENSF